MNFTSFGSPFQATLPSMHQFATKFADPVIVNNTSGMVTGQNTVMVTTIAGDGTTGGIQYLPLANANSGVHMHTSQGQSPTRLASLPSNIQVVNSMTSTPGAKYSPGTIIGWENVPMHHFTTVDPKVVPVTYNAGSLAATNQTVNSPAAAVWPVRLISNSQEAGALEYTDILPQDLCKQIKEEKEVKLEKPDEKMEVIQIPVQTTWQDPTGATVVDYLSRLPPTSIPISLHHFLKYTTDTVKREGMQELTLISGQQLPPNTLLQVQDSLGETPAVETELLQNKKKKKRQKAKEKKQRYRPGEIRLSTALDGSTLFCCPECHMAYPERLSLEQHLAGHKLERRFVCDVCGAGLKRKEHLDQHKRGHSHERPFVCSICSKGFKRNEHLTRHFVIHSGDKSYVCPECGKGFSRKDHLHKHSQTHISKRVKAELSQQSLPSVPSVPVPAPVVS